MEQFLRQNHIYKDNSLGNVQHKSHSPMASSVLAVNSPGISTSNLTNVKYASKATHSQQIKGSARRTLQFLGIIITVT